VEHLNDTLPTVVLPRALESSLGRGHFWIYRDHVPESFGAPAGSWVRVRVGRFVGYALWDPASPIALRVFSRQQLPDAPWVAERVHSAWQLRQAVRDQRTNAFRWIAGEGDGLPGVVVDHYAGFLVLVTSSDALEPIVPWVLDALGRVTPLRGILRRRRHEAREPARAIWGRKPGAELIVEEHGVRFLANLASGQKTGLFLDQRDNRRFVATLSAGRRMLNLFSYSGGFSVHAALGGAAEVTSVDSAAPALADARRNFELNGLDPEAHHFVEADVYEYLTSAQKRGVSFDLVVCDPPSLAHKKEQAESAVRAYRRLFALSLGATAPGGYVALSSCTTQVGPERFRDLVADAAARAGTEFQIIHEAGQPIDHPVFAHHPEGRYLKFVVGRKVGRR
jgi:23S rRNA (cytosine1962-C5)-methyltransferase